MGDVSKRELACVGAEDFWEIPVFLFHVAVNLKLLLKIVSLKKKKKNKILVLREQPHPHVGHHGLETYVLQQ